MDKFFDVFPTEKVKIIKQDSEIIEDVKALVDSGTKTIFINDGTLDIEEGDIIVRTLPAGRKEEYEVIDPGFYRGDPMLGIPDEYQVKVRRKTKFFQPEKGSLINNYNIYDSEGVFIGSNVGTIDNSINCQMSKNDVELMDYLRKVASSLENATELINAINEMQSNIGKTSFRQKYNDFIQVAANHMTFFAPLISKLTELL